MLKSSLGNSNEAHLAISGNSKQQGDVKLHRQLPGYDDSQCYDLGQVIFCADFFCGFMIISADRRGELYRITCFW